MAGLIGKKIGMTSIFDDQGKNVPCTVIEAGPCVVTQIKTEDIDGYNSVQIGFGDKKEKKCSKSEMGHLNKSKSSAKKKYVEFPIFKIKKTNAEGEGNFEELKLGDSIKVSDVFSAGEFVDVAGTSKGKGFQGVVKRHGFAGVGDATHGQHNRMRAPGSIGAASYPARVFKGMRMAGRMGGERVTLQNLKVLKVMEEKNVLIIKGAIPGPRNSYVEISN